MRNTLKTLLLAGTVLGGMSVGAQAVITLENPGLTTFQQTLNNPCVIGDPSCNNPAGFGVSIIPSGPQAVYDITSPTYTVTQLLGILGSTSFNVGVDVNTTTQPLATERLDFFGMYINGILSAANTYDPAGPGTQLFTVNNGNGYSDELLKGFSLAGLSGSTQISFRTIVNTATDGREEFFLISSASRPVPEPTSLMLLGLGMTALGVAKRRRKNVTTDTAAA